MKSLDELKGPRKRKKKRRSADTPASTQTLPDSKTLSRFKKPVGVPTMPRKGHDDSYELNYLYDAFDK